VRLLVDSVVSARHLARYQSLRSAQRRADGATRAIAVRALLRYGVPAIAPMLALFFVALGHSGRGYAVSIALSLTALLAYVGGRPPLHGFDLLRHPSRRGLVLGSLHRVAGRDGSDPLIWVMWAVVAIAAASLLPEMSVGWILVLAVVVSVAIARRSALSTLSELAFTIVVLVLVGLPVLGERAHGYLDASTQTAVLGVSMFAATIALVVSEFCTQLRHVDRASVVRWYSDDGEASVAGSEPTVTRLRRERAGAGAPAAMRRYLADEWLPDPDTRPGWRVRSGEWMGTLLLAVFHVLRGPIVAVVAVALSGAEHGGVLVGVAVLASVCASRAGSFESYDLDERAWLLGVDYRTQVVHGLRCLLLVGVLPTLVAAGVAVLVLSPFDTARQATVLLIAAAFLLRAGLVGFWPSPESTAVLVSGLWGSGCVSSD